MSDPSTLTEHETKFSLAAVDPNSSTEEREDPAEIRETSSLGKQVKHGNFNVTVKVSDKSKPSRFFFNFEKLKQRFLFLFVLTI